MSLSFTLINQQVKYIPCRISFLKRNSWALLGMFFVLIYAVKNQINVNEKCIMHANTSKNRVRQVHYDTSNHIVLRHNTTRQ